jgi:hypothetical protein
VDDVEVAACQREPQVRLHADRDAHLRAARDRDGGPDRDDVPRGRVAVDHPAAGEEVGGARRGREHGHGVPEGPKPARDARDVLVDVVRLRPRKRRDEADAHNLTLVVRPATVALRRSCKNGPGRAGRHV